jgi:hypothetical protein
MMTCRPQFGLSEGLSTIDESARMRASIMPARSRSTHILLPSGTPASQLPQSNNPAVNFNGRPPAHPHKAATTDESHSHRLASETNHTYMNDGKLQPLTSTVWDLLPDNFRYGFLCPPISYDGHNCPQIQNFGCMEGTCRLSANFHVQLIPAFTRGAPASPHSSTLSSEWTLQRACNHHLQSCPVALTAPSE